MCNRVLSYPHSNICVCSYVIPTPVIDHFLTDYRRNGKFTGFPSLGIRWQRMESDPLRCASLAEAKTSAVTACCQKGPAAPCRERHPTGVTSAWQLSAVCIQLKSTARFVWTCTCDIRCCDVAGMCTR